MEFVWNEAKRAEIYKKHGIDLLDAALIFENEVLEKEDTRRDYVYRLITAWKGGQRDRAEYEKRNS